MFSILFVKGIDSMFVLLCNLYGFILDICCDFEGDLFEICIFF